jgi:hypothetical protein
MARKAKVDANVSVVPETGEDGSIIEKAPEIKVASMDVVKYRVRFEFTTPVLGSQPSQSVYTDFLAKKIQNETGGVPADEIGTLPEELARGTTVFSRNAAGEIVFWDYQVKGFIKEAGRNFNGLYGIKALRAKIDNYVFVSPRQIVLHLPQGENIDYLERPLRAETAQGPRVTVVRSERAPEGSWFEFTLHVYEKQSRIDKDMLSSLMEYGIFKGMGQWRNGNWGSFEFAWI